MLIDGIGASQRRFVKPSRQAFGVPYVGFLFV